MRDFVFSLLLGVGPGAVFAVLAVGVVVAYRGSGVINFSHGAIAMYTALTFNRLRSEARVGGDSSIFLPWVDIVPDWDWLVALRLNNLPVRIGLGTEGPLPVWAALGVSLTMAGLIGVGAHYFVFRPLRGASPLSKIVASVGVMIYLQAVATLHFGTTLRSDPGWSVFRPDHEPLRNFLNLGPNYPQASLWLLGGAIVVVAVVWAIINLTDFGLAARAVDENERAMVLLGYSADRIAGITWVFSAVIAGAIGVMYVGFTQPSNMTLFVVPALGAALVGRLTSVLATAAGAIAIGMLQSGGVFVANREWFPDWLPPSGVRQVIPLLIVIAVLFLRGDKLPTRGGLITRGEPRAPMALTPLRAAAIGAGFVIFLLTWNGWKIESGLTSTMIAGIFMLSIVVLVGFLGQISLAQWSLAGLAAFVMIRLAADGTLIRAGDGVAKSGPNWPDPLAAAGGIAVAIVAGLIIGLPAVRVRGLQLAIISITAVVAIESLLLGNNALMGAGANANNPTPRPNWFGFYTGAAKNIDDTGAAIGTPDNPAFTVLVLLAATVSAIAVAQLRRGPTGRRFLAIRSNERAAAAAGINVAHTKLLGFGIAAALAGVSGVLFAYKLPSLSSSNFGLFPGLGLLAFAYIAGVTTVPGAFVGGILVSGGLLSAMSTREAGSALLKYNPLIGAFGLLAAALLANGEGVLRLSDRWGRWRAHWNDRETELATWGTAGRIPVLVLGGIAGADFVARGGLSIAVEDLQDEFGFTDFQAGLIPFADVVAGALVVVGAGYLADRMSRTAILRVLMVVWALTSASTGLVQSFGHLLMIRVALGAMTAIDDPASSSLLADYYPASIRHKAFSWRLVAPILGGAFGNLAIGLALDRWGWRWGFVVASLPALILIWFVARLPEPVRGASDGRSSPKADKATDAAPATSWRKDLAAMRKVKSLPLLIAASALSFGPAVGVTFWAPTFLRRHHDLTAGEAAGLFGFASLGGALLGATIASRWPERYRHIQHIEVWIAGLGSIFGIALLVLAYSPTPVSLKFPFLLLGAAGLVAAGPIINALISRVTPPSIRGSVFSLNSFCRLSLSAVTPLVVGLVADQVDFVDRDVPVAIVEDRAVVEREDRYECDDRGRVVPSELFEDDAQVKADRKQYECGDKNVGHLGAGMVAMLAVGATSGLFALRARRYLEHDYLDDGGLDHDTAADSGGDVPVAQFAGTTTDSEDNRHV